MAFALPFDEIVAVGLGNPAVLLPVLLAVVGSFPEEMGNDFIVSCVPQMYTVLLA
jgi:hypothetical protein